MRVAVTGIGLVTPLGGAREDTWRAVRDGVCGLDRLPPDLFDGSGDCVGGLPPAASRAPGTDRSIRYALSAASEAAQDSGLVDAYPRDRIACVIGSSKGGVSTLLAHVADPLASPADLLRRYLPCMPSICAAETVGLEGPVLAETASCATGVACIARAVACLRRGRCDAALAGSTDASLSEVILAGFRNLGALSREDCPERACKPFDRRRDGFLIGEGAAVFALEPLERARRRGASIYAVLAGLAMGSEAYHETQPDPSGAGLLRVIRASLAQAEVGPEKVDYVNAHGTATRLGDVAEAMALRQGFGRGTLASSTKPQTGHLLGASSAVEVGLTLLALRDSWAPGTLNLEEPDEACRIEAVPPGGRAGELRCVASVSAGFGGQVGVVTALRQEDAP